MNMWFMGASITWHRFVDGLWDKVRCPLVHFDDIACGVNGVLGLAQVRDTERRIAWVAKSSGRLIQGRLDPEALLKPITKLRQVLRWFLVNSA